jgi:NADH-ubiquinone oxidoreductase chain 2
MLIYSVLFLLLSNAVTLRRDKSILYSRVSITVLLYSSAIALGSLYLTNLDTGIGLFGGLFHASSTTHVFHLFIFLISAAIIQLTGFYPRRVWIAEYSSLTKLFMYNFMYYRTKITNKMGEQFKIIEYPLILLFIITGATFLVSSSDLVSIFLSIELQSYGLYLLSTLYRNSELATSGGLTYFLLGGLSSCFILLGTALLYANSGTTNLDGLYVITSLSDMASSAQEQSSNILYWYKPHYINMSLLILSVGFLFKVSAAPFHFWSPDVYDAIPTIVTAFVAIVAKISIFIFFLELVHYTSNSLFENQFSWTMSLLVSSLFSLLIGTIVGLTQFRIKRLFAYSTISHVGFILLALSINSIESIQAFIFYLMQYSISNLNAFVILISIGFSLYFYINDSKEYKELQDKNNSPIQLISQIKGFFYINPVLALSFAITIFSFVGIPPLIGFFAKQMVLSAALDSGYIFITLIAILTSVISAVYYLNIIKQVFFDKPEYKINPAIDNMTLHGNITKNNNLVEKLTFKLDSIKLSSSLTITISVLTLVILLFMLMPQQWLSMANILALIIFNP